MYIVVCFLFKARSDSEPGKDYARPLVSEMEKLLKDVQGVQRGIAPSACRAAIYGRSGVSQECVCLRCWSFLAVAAPIPSRVDGRTGQEGRGLYPKMEEPELMYKLFDKVVGSIDDVIEAI